jgi:UDP-galactopyranose mutase
MYDYIDSNGLMIQKYGVHVFHTKDDNVWNFVSRFATLRPHNIKSYVDFDDGTPLVSSPFNFDCIDAWYDKKDADYIKNKLLAIFPNRDYVTMAELFDAQDRLIGGLIKRLYESDFLPYALKQWGFVPEQLDKSIINRAPLYLNYNKLFQNERFGLPSDSFLQLFKKMLDHPNIVVETNIDALKRLKIDNNTIYYNGEPIKILVVWTGKIDELFGYPFGDLGYRSLDFRFDMIHSDCFQSGESVVHPLAKDYTRIIDFKYLYDNDRIQGVTMILKEYPFSPNRGDEAHYPLLKREEQERYARYKTLADQIPNLYLAGRLADFKYYNMDQAVERAFEVFERLLK